MKKNQLYRKFFNLRKHAEKGQYILKCLTASHRFHSELVQRSEVQLQKYDFLIFRISLNKTQQVCK